MKITTFVLCGACFLFLKPKTRSLRLVCVLSILIFHEHTYPKLQYSSNFAEQLSKVVVLSHSFIPNLPLF